MTLTSFVFAIFYLIFLVTSTIIYFYYFICGRDTTTIIPCLSSVWYQAYTILLFALAIALIALACIETRWSVCGYYTTWPGPYDPCNVMPTSSSTTNGFFGIAVFGKVSYAYGKVTQAEGLMSVMTFDRYCVRLRTLKFKLIALTRLSRSRDLHLLKSSRRTCTVDQLLFLSPCPPLLLPLVGLRHLPMILCRAPAFKAARMFSTLVGHSGREYVC